MLLQNGLYLSFPLSRSTPLRPCRWVSCFSPLFILCVILQSALTLQRTEMDSPPTVVRSLAEDLMLALGPKVYEAGNFIVADALEANCPISFVSQGFCNLTGGVAKLLGLLDFEVIFFTGYSREECLGRNCKFLQGKETDQHTVQAIRKVFF
jgi:hypothetical protein